MSVNEKDFARTRKKLILAPFEKMMVIGIFVFLVTGACVLIDNLFVGRYLGTEALAAVGFYSPVTTAIQLCYVIIVGMQIVSANLIGSARFEDVKKLFFSCFMMLGIIFLIFSLATLIFREPLAYILGARGNTAILLSDYIAGYSMGIAPQALVALLVAITSFNNVLRRSYVVTAILVIGNTLGDLLLVEPLGLFGIALSSSLTSIVALIYILPSFLPEDKLFSLRRSGGFDMQLLWVAVKRGFPSAMLTLGLIIKNSLFNYALSSYVGDAGVAVVNIMATVNIIAGAFPQGISNAYSSLAGLYFGEDDRNSFLDLFRIVARTGTILSGLLTLMLILFSSQISGLFFVPSSEAFAIGRRMICLEYLFIIPNLLLNLLLKSYQVQGRTLLMSIMYFAETSAVGLFTLLMVPFFGSDAAWLSNTIIDVIMIGVIIITVFWFKEGFDMSLPSMLKLSEEFGASDDEYREFTIADRTDVSEISDQVIDFCKSRNYNKKTSFYVGLCIEEMAANVLEHGVGTSQRYSIDIRVVARDELTVRICDDCRAFDPRERQNLYDPESPEKNIGIRLTTKLAKEIDYYNNAGINTLLMKF